jgi:N-acetylmuramoyl-L-alanine amidase
MRRAYLFLLLSLLISPGILARQLILTDRDAQIVNAELPVVFCAQIPYISLQQLAQIYKVKTWERAEAAKIVIYFPQREIKVTAASAFITVNREIFQIGTPAVKTDLDYYVPAEPFLAILQQHVSLRLRYKYYDGGSSSYLHSCSAVVQPTALPLVTAPEKVNLSNMLFEEKSNGIAIKVQTTQPFSDADLTYFFHGGNGFFLSINRGICDPLVLSRYHPTHSIEMVEAIQDTESVQLRFNLNRHFTSSVVQYDFRTSQIVLSLYLPLNEDIKSKLELAKNEWVIDTIVLDPGHGGKAIGTPGRWGYMHEKDIVLDIVLRLGALLEKRSDLNVVYTRKTDVDIPLWQRAEIANRAGGKLFISLHVDGVNNTSAKGVCLYLLRPGKSKEAIEVAERENAVIQFEEAKDIEKYKGYDDISNILANMVHKAYMEDSERLAEIMSRHISSEVPQKNRGVKQAGFYVLIGAAMPKLLCELGFNSNRSDAKLLNTKKHRQLLAEVLYQSIIEFKEYCDRTVVKQQ